jgi:hypothetical protein
VTLRPLVPARDAGRDVLLLRDGSRRVVARLPEALRGAVGSDGDVGSFGIIADRQ